MQPTKRAEAWINGEIRDALLSAERQRREATKVLKVVRWHLEELREAWERGVIAEHDGKGGTRSNHNLEVLAAVCGERSAEEAFARMGVAEAEALLEGGKCGK